MVPVERNSAHLGQEVDVNGWMGDGQTQDALRNFRPSSRKSTCHVTPIELGHLGDDPDPRLQERSSTSVCIR